jgi:cbb3-type cytochrome c oxidase subunit III
VKASLVLLAALGAGLIAIPALALGREAAANPAAGAAVFRSAGCAACHTLRAAGAKGQVGPNLDRLKPTEAQVRAQVRSGGGGMPSFAKQLSARQISDVAVYVAAASRGKRIRGPAKPAPPLSGKALFRVTCGGCHTLADAGTKGKVGPNLDDESPSYDKVMKQMLEGGGGMPSFRRSLTLAKRKRIAGYVARAAGGGHD